MSQVEMDKNCEAARHFAECILVGLPVTDVEIYVPGGPTEEFVSRAVSKRMLTFEQVLKIDCDILRSKDMLIVWVPEGDDLNGGRQVEFDFAMEHDIIVYTVQNVAQAVQYIRQTMETHNAI